MSRNTEPARRLTRRLARRLAWRPARRLALGAGTALILATLPAGPLAAAIDTRPETDPERIVDRLANAETRDEGGAELLVWIRELSPERASHWLRLAVALDRLPPDQVGSVAHAVLRSDPVVETNSARRVEAARGLRDEALGLPPADQPVLLALAAHLLEPQAPGESLELRRGYLAAGFEGPEAAEVVMAVARVLLGGTGEEGGVPGVSAEAPAVEARRILDDFLERAPEHPMAPEARRLRTLAVRMGRGTT